MTWSSTDLQHEGWLVNRLKVHGLKVFDGDTTPEIRKQRVREAINTVGADVICGSAGGKPVLYRTAFERLYGEPL